MNVYLLRYNSGQPKAQDASIQRALSLKLLDYAMKRETGAPAGRRAHTEKGKPYIRNCPVKFNISHTEGMVAVAVGKGEIGADVEKIGEFSQRLARRVLTEKEYTRVTSSENPAVEFYLLWTFKEAFVKFIGSGLSYPLKKATLDEGESVLSVYPELKIVSFAEDGYAFTFIEEGGNHINFIKLDHSLFIDS